MDGYYKIAAIIGFIVIAILVILGFIKGGLYKAQIPRNFKDWFPNGLKGLSNLCILCILEESKLWG